MGSLFSCVLFTLTHWLSAGFISVFWVGHGRSLFCFSFENQYLAERKSDDSFLVFTYPRFPWEMLWYKLAEVFWGEALPQHHRFSTALNRGVFNFILCYTPNQLHCLQPKSSLLVSSNQSAWFSSCSNSKLHMFTGCLLKYLFWHLSMSFECFELPPLSFCSLWVEAR